MAARTIFLLLLLALAVLAVFGNSLTGEFLYDDQPYVTKNPQVTGEDPVSSLFLKSTPPDRAYLGLYRPLFVLSLRVNHLIAGFKPSVFHGTNVLIHLLCVWALFFLVLRLTEDRAAAFLGALLFAVHPVHVEAVTWIVGRAELLSLLFCLAAALCHFKTQKSALFLALEGLFFVLAALSKENALLFPLLLLLLDRRHAGIKAFIRSFGLYLPLGAAVVLARFWVLGRLSPAIETAPFKDVAWIGRGEGALACLADYLTLMVVPYPLKIFYHISEIDRLTWGRLVVLALFGLMVFLCFRLRARALPWLVWIPVSLLAVLNLVPIGAVFAERFLYLPSVGACVAGGLALSAMIRKETARRGTHLAIWLPTAIVLVFSVLTFARNPVFESSFSLWKDAVKKGGKYAFPHYNLGEAYFEKEILEFQSPENPGAISCFKESLRLNPDHPYAFAAHYRLGQCYLFRYRSRDRAFSNLEQAVFHLEESIRKAPPLPEAQWKPALILAQIPLEKDGDRLVSLDKARDYLALAALYLGSGDPIEGIRRRLDQREKGSSHE